MSGDLNMGGHSVINLGAPSVATDAATKGYVDDNYVKKTGDVMTGSLTINNPTDTISVMGCTNLANTKIFTISMGDLNNEILLSS